MTLLWHPGAGHSGAPGSSGQARHWHFAEDAGGGIRGRYLDEEGSLWDSPEATWKTFDGGIDPSLLCSESSWEKGQSPHGGLEGPCNPGPVTPMIHHLSFWTSKRTASLFLSEALVVLPRGLCTGCCPRQDSSWLTSLTSFRTRFKCHLLKQMSLHHGPSPGAPDSTHLSSSNILHN